MVIGGHGAGKSTILDGLGLLAQSRGAEGLQLEGRRISGVTFRDMVHKHLERETMDIGVTVRLEGPVPPVIEADTWTVSYDIQCDNTPDRRFFRQQEARFEFGTQVWEFVTPRMGRWTTPPDLRLPKRPPASFSDSTYTLMPFRFFLGGRDYALHRSLETLRLALSEELARNVHLVPAERMISRNLYPDKGAPQEAPWGGVEEVVSALAYDWDLRDQVSGLLWRVVGRKIGFVRGDGEIRVEASNHMLHPVLCEGSGMRQLVWPLAALAVAPPGSLVAIEEPEIHLHPQAQARLAEELGREALRRELRLLVTTHSEHILMALLTAVAKKEMRPHELCIYYLEVGDGVASAERLEVDERGAVRGGLKGFFEEGLSQLEMYLQALASGGGAVSEA